MKVDDTSGNLTEMDDADYADFEAKHPRQALWVGTENNIRQTAWWKICNKLLKNLLREKDSKPFKEPVDPVALNILDYHMYIKHPMDLGYVHGCFISILNICILYIFIYLHRTIEKRLMAIPCQYTNPHDFINDVRMVFRNCYVYNKRQTYVCIFFFLFVSIHIYTYIFIT